MKRVMWAGLIAFLMVLAPVALAEGDASHDELKAIAKELSQQKREANKKRTQAYKAGKDDQGLKDLKAKRAEVDKEIDAKLRELSPEYGEQMKKIEELQQAYNDKKKEIMDARKKDGKKKDKKNDKKGEE